jgi:uncharacterized protein (TIGR02186 family)
MKSLRAYIAVFAGVLALSGGAWADQLVTDLSEHQIAIRSNFTGTQVLLFGAIEANTPEERLLDRDIVIVVSGPTRPITVRHKERIGGIWVNRVSLTFPRVPGYYAVASTRPLEVTAKNETLRVHQIGIDNLDVGMPVAQGFDGSIQALDPEQERVFQKALIRNKRREGLFIDSPAGVTFLGQTLFRATLEIPANVPVGLYTANVYLMRNGAVVDAISAPLYIDKSGIERFTYRFAHNQSLLYGLAVILGSALMGWIASLVYQRR